MCATAVYRSVGRSVSDKAASGASTTKKKFGIRNQGRLKSRDSLSEGRTKIGGLRVTRSRCEPNYVVSAINAAAAVPAKDAIQSGVQLKFCLPFGKLPTWGPASTRSVIIAFFTCIYLHCTDGVHSVLHTAARCKEAIRRNMSHGKTGIYGEAFPAVSYAGGKFQFHLRGPIY